MITHQMETYLSDDSANKTNFKYVFKEYLVMLLPRHFIKLLNKHTWVSKLYPVKFSLKVFSLPITI